MISRAAVCALASGLVLLAACGDASRSDRDPTEAIRPNPALAAVRDVEPAGPAEGAAAKVRRVHGVVLDPEGRPVPRARVQLLAWEPDPDAPHTVIHTVTDRSGVFSADTRGWIGATIAARAERFAVSAPVEALFPETASQVDAGDVVLRRGGSASGVVRDATGAAVGGAEVLAARPSENGWVYLLEPVSDVDSVGGEFWAGSDTHHPTARTDDEGRWKLEGLDPGAWVFRATTPSLAPRFSGVTELPDAEHVRVPVFTLVPGGVVAGEVRDAAGRHVAGLKVRVDTRHEQSRVVSTRWIQRSFESTFRLWGVPAGERELSLEAPGFYSLRRRLPSALPPLQATLRALPSVRLSFSEPAGASTAVAQLGISALEVQDGRWVDIYYESIPVADSRVEGGQRVVSLASTSIAGAAPSVRLWVIAKDGRFAWSGRIDLSSPCSAAELPARIRFRSAVTCAGRIEDSLGNPIEGAIVRYRPPVADSHASLSIVARGGDRALPHVRTGADGTFTIRVTHRGSPVVLQIDHPDYRSHASAALEVVGDRLDAPPRIRLAPRDDR